MAKARLPRDRDRHSRVEPDQLPARAGGVGVQSEILAPLRAGDVIGMREQMVERAMGLEQFGGNLRADAGHSRHVVDRIAHERQKVDDLIRPDAPVDQQFLRTEEGVVPQVQQPHVVAQQLPRVFVGRGDDAVTTRRDGADGNGGKEVVGLEARPFEARNAHHIEQSPDERNLRHEVGGHLRAGGLVGGKFLMAKRRAGRIDGADEIIGLLLLDDVEQVAGEAKHGRHRRAVGRCHLRQRMKELVDPRECVDHPDRLPTKIRIGRRRGSCVGRHE